MVFTISEIINIAITIVGLGIIFTGFLPQKHDNIEELLKPSILNFQKIKYAIIVTAPAILLHEFAHKFTALSLGLKAIYHASIGGLGLGIILRLVGSSFLILVPGYVSVSGAGPGSFYSLVALAGPLTNLALFGLFSLALNKDFAPKYNYELAVMKKINFFLFVFNMIPIPGFDGFHVLRNLF
jgi:Zn-dependent protease